MKNKWKIAFFTCLTLLITLFVCSAYMIIDQGVSYSYLSDTLYRKDQDLKLMADIYPKNTSQKDLVFILRQARPDGIIVEKDKLVHINEISFEFSDNDTIKHIDTNEMLNSFHSEPPLNSLEK